MQHSSYLLHVLTCLLRISYIYAVPRGGGGVVVFLQRCYLNCLLMGSLCVCKPCMVSWCGLVGGWEKVIYVRVLIKTSNMGLCMSVNVSFICNPLFVFLYIWNLSNVLSLGPFFSIRSIFIMWSIVS
jgi:hypothetical protein